MDNEKLKKLLERKDEHYKELKILLGTKSYYEENKQRKISNIINVMIYLICLSLVGGISFLIATKTFILGTILLSTTIGVGGVGLIKQIYSIKKQKHNEEIKKFYIDNYGLDIDNTDIEYLNEQGLSHLRVQISREEVILDNINNEIKKIKNNDYKKSTPEVTLKNKRKDDENQCYIKKKTLTRENY